MKVARGAVGCSNWSSKPASTALARFIGVQLYFSPNPSSIHRMRKEATLQLVAGVASMRP